MPPSPKKPRVAGPSGSSDAPSATTLTVKLPELDWKGCTGQLRRQLDDDTLITDFVRHVYGSQISTLQSILTGVALRKDNATALVLGPMYGRLDLACRDSTFDKLHISGRFCVCAFSTRGCCKSAVVRNAIHQANEEIQACVSDGSTQPFLLVELHGSTLDDDVVAAKELCRQLSSGNTLPRTRKPSMEHYLQFFLDSLKEAKAGSVPVVIILHDFEEFARRTKQTLLYNLFDITQCAAYQICVIGTTTRLDVTELLEKRLRSRFSCRQVLLSQPPQDAVAAFIHSALTIERRGSEVVSRTASPVSKWNAAVETTLATPPVKALVGVGFVVVVLCCRCVCYVCIALSQLERMWRCKRSVRWYQRWLLLCLTEVASPAELAATLERGAKTMGAPLEPEAQAAATISQLAPCDLLLLVAFCKLELARELPTYSFEMAQGLYSAYYRKSASGKQVQQSTVFCVRVT